MQARKSALTKTWPCWHPDPRLLVSRTIRKYISGRSPVYIILLWQYEQTKKASELTICLVIRMDIIIIPELQNYCENWKRSST